MRSMTPASSMSAMIAMSAMSAMMRRALPQRVHLSGSNKREADAGVARRARSRFPRTPFQPYQRSGTNAVDELVHCGFVSVALPSSS